MKYILLIFATVLVNKSYSQDKLKKGMTLFVVQYGDTINKTDYLGKQGKWIAYKDKNISSVENYTNDKKNGEFAYYYSGSRILKGSYNNDRFIDTCIFYKKNRLLYYIVYDSLGNKNKKVIFYRNGKQKFVTKSFYYNNKMYPYYDTFFRNGNPKSLSRIIDSIGTEKTTYYTRKGTIRKEI